MDILISKQNFMSHYFMIYQMTFNIMINLLINSLSNINLIYYQQVKKNH